MNLLFQRNCPAAALKIKLNNDNCYHNLSNIAAIVWNTALPSSREYQAFVFFAQD